MRLKASEREKLGHEARQRGKQIVDEALAKCAALGVKISVDCGGFSTDIDQWCDLNFEVNLNKYKHAIRFER